MSTPNQKWYLWFLLAILITWILGFQINAIFSPDVYLHLRDGRHLLESGLHVDQEPFAYTVSHVPFDKAEWLFKIVIYPLHQLGGFNLVILFKALVMTGALILLGVLVYRRWPNVFLLALMAYLGTHFPLVRGLAQRPYIFTYLFIPLCMLLLDNYRLASHSNEKKASRQLLWLPLISLLWVNLHPAFIVLLCFLGAHLLEAAFLWWRTSERAYLSRLLKLGSLTVCCFLIGGLNPSGFQIYSLILSHTDPEQLKHFKEWVPPQFIQLPVFYFMLAAVWLTHVFSLWRMRISDILPLLVFSYLALKSYRHIPLFAIAAMPLWAEHLRFLREQWFGKIKLSNAWQNGLLLGIGILGLVFLFINTHQGNTFIFGEQKNKYPTLALEWIEQQNVQGRLFTVDYWSGYVSWQTHGKKKIFVDGRLPIFGAQVYKDYRDIIYGSPKFSPLLDQYQVESLLVFTNPRKLSPDFYQQLAGSNKWALVYWDHVSLLYVRRQGVNQDLVQKFEYQALNPLRSPFFDINNISLATQELEQAKAASPKSYLPFVYHGELLRLAKNYPAAEKAFEKAKLLDPEYYVSDFKLGILAYEQKRFQEAETLYLKALKVCPNPDIKSFIYYHLAILKQATTQNPAALRYVKKALKTKPDSKAYQQFLKQLEKQ
jgi:tetratricopeptide (TPR) repeat protein